MKLVVNSLLGVGMQAIAEAVALGQKAGLNRDRLFDVLSHTAVIAPAYVGKLTKAASNDYNPQFAMRLMNKDFRLIQKTAAELGVPMPATAAAFQINTAEAAQSVEEDFSAVIRLVENLAHVNSHQNERDNLQNAKLEIRNPKFETNSNVQKEKPPKRTRFGFSN
jgi:3-hydroxyisobutyrate dehydrogenase-like beta-hydroxyacid dehydrogenase